MYPIMNLNQMQEEDVTKLEKLVDRDFGWRKRKMRNIRLAQLYDVAGWKEKGDLAASCGTWLQFNATAAGERSLQAANFCQLRLCPLCIARRARKLAYQLNLVMNQTQARYGYEFIFLTLTTRNVCGNNLGAELSVLTQGWDRLVRQRPVQRACKGWYRAIEITRNADFGSYHPHIHAIEAVEPGYFKRSSGLYITQAEWVARWQKAARLNYKPVVDVKKTYDKKGGKGAVLEASKYATKDDDYINPNLTDEEGAQIVVDYTKALHKRRLVAFGGCMKEIAVQLGADGDDGDLVHVDDERLRDDLAELIEDYGWHFGAGDYVLTDRRVNPLKVVREE